MKLKIILFSSQNFTSIMFFIATLCSISAYTAQGSQRGRIYSVPAATMDENYSPISEEPQVITCAFLTTVAGAKQPDKKATFCSVPPSDQDQDYSPSTYAEVTACLDCGVQHVITANATCAHKKEIKSFISQECKASN